MHCISITHFASKVIMPLVSVIIPVYNGEKYIVETIRSVQHQIFWDFEIIVVDDASSDQTVATVQAIQEPRLRIIAGGHKGVSAARNQGIAASQGEFIAFLDADDLWAPDKLRLQVEAFQNNPEAGLGYSWFYLWNFAVQNTTDDKTLICPSAEGSQAFRTLLEENVVGTGSNIFVRRAVVESVGNFNETLTHGEDWEFCFRVALAWGVSLIPQPLVYYRQHQASSCSSLEQVKDSTLKAIHQIFDQAPQDLKPLKVKVYANLYLYLANLYLTRTNTVEGIREARQNWIKCMWTWPSYVFHRRFIRLTLKVLFLSVMPFRLSRSLLFPQNLDRQPFSTHK
jgi:glycosyltransferase involved in cell wall biosynthesis